ncbi:hypothetical protein ABVT39_009425 [Epinephelus coioides]
MADYRNHLCFNLRCRQHRIIPNSLRLGSTVKGHMATTILQRAQNQLLNKRVRQIHFTIDALKSKMEQILGELTALLPREVLEDVYKFVVKAQTQHCNTPMAMKDRHQNS